MIDPFKRCLTDRVTHETLPTETTFYSVFSVIPSVNPSDVEVSNREADHEDSDYTHLWTQFPEVTEPSLGKVVTMTTPLHITTDGSPVYTPCRKLHGEKKVQEEALVDDTFLRQRQRRRDLQTKQLQTPACVPGSVPPSVVSNQVPHANEANSSPIPSPVTITSDSPTCCISGANHRNVTPSTVEY